MSYRPTDISPPFAGTDTGSAEETPRANTTRLGRNVRPRDWKYYGRTRMAQRPGLTALLGGDAMAADTRIDSLVSSYIVENSGDTAVGAVVYTDNFTGRATPTVAADELGSFTGAATADYNTTGSDAASGTHVGATDQNMLWNSAVSSAIINASDKCVDNQNADTSAADAAVSFCYLRPDAGAPLITDNFSLQLTFTMEATAGASETLLGFMVCGVAGTVSGGAADSAYFLGVKVTSGSQTIAVHNFNNATSVGGFQWNRLDRFTENSGQYLKKPDFTVGAAYDTTLNNGSLTALYIFGAGTTHILECRKIGTRVQLLIDDVMIVDVANIAQRKDGSGVTPVTTTNADYGFAFYNVGSGARAAVVSIDKFEVYNAVANAPPMSTNLLGVAAGDVYVGNEDEMAVASSGGTDALGTVANTCAIVGPGPGSTSGAGFQYVYLLDGTSYKKSKLPTGAVTAWTASGGSSLPSAAFDSSVKARYGVLWRNRIVLYGVSGNNDLIYAAKQGDADDWNYSPTFPDGTEAWNFNAPVPVFCVHPLDEDRLLIAGADKLLYLTADYADGGGLEEISASIGIIGHYAATKDDRGNTYFVSHQGGLYVIAKGGTDPESLSKGRRDDFFNSIPTTATVRLVWTNAEEGLHIFVVPSEEGTTPTEHLFWDRASNSFWDDTLPPEYGPTAHCILNNSAGLEVLVIGGWDGYLRYFDADAVDDDGEDIDAEVDYPLLINGSFERVILGTTEIRLGASEDQCTVGIVAAKSAKEINGTTPRVSRSCAGTDRQARITTPVGGSAVAIRVGNNGGGRFSVEAVRAHIEPGGTAL